jgi:uncharacterized repeat protein (TIGR03809 family)
MPAQIPRRMSAQITQKWRDLAERRRDHFKELYDTGRWKHYYSEEVLVARTREAVYLAETWEQLSAPPGSPKKFAAE